MALSQREIDNLIASKHALVSTADEVLLDGLEATQKSIFSKVLGITSKMSQKRGKFVWDGKRAEILQITKAVQEAILKSTYRGKVDQFLRTFDEIEDTNKIIVGELNEISTSKINLTDEKRATVDDITKRLTSPASISANISQPVSDILYKHARFALSVSDAENALRELITNTEASSGIVNRYVGQIARDSINQYNGTVYQVMQREYGLNAYQYVGGTVKDSRPQCIRWLSHNEGVLTRDYLDKELAEATQIVLTGRKSSRFKGYSKYTLPLAFETFAIYRGGHSCLHESIPIKG